MRSLLATTPAPWPLGRSIRSAVTIASPVLIGALTDHAVVGMWISMGTLLLSAGEHALPYRARFRQVTVSAPMVAAACFLGALSSAPHVVMIIVMAAVAGTSGVLSGYSGVLSIATMQAVVIAAITIGVPAARPYWEPAVLFIAGAALYASALAIEAAVNRLRPQRDSLVSLLLALAAVARAQAAGNTDLAAERSHAINALDAFDQMTIAGRGLAGGPTTRYDRAARVSRAADQLLARLLAYDADRERSAATASRLDDCVNALNHRSRPPARPSDGTLIRLAMLEDAVWGDSPRAVALPPAERVRLTLPGPALLASAGRLSLCTALAYTAYILLPIAHGYWIPLTVALVMKPDLGSVFSRAMLRCLGTVCGAVIAVAVAVLVDGPVVSGLCVALFAACLPWAMARSYLWQALFLTPLVMVLLDMVVPHESVPDISEARVATTVVGGVIVIVAGYLIWPATRHAQMAGPFNDTLAVLGQYAHDVAVDAPADTVSADRRAVYRRLSDARTTLQRTLSEPSPAGAEAWAWIPVISATERVADRVTSAAASLTAPATTPSAAELSALADELTALEHRVSRRDVPHRAPTPPDRADLSPDPAIRELADELAHLRSLIGRDGTTRSADSASLT